MMEKDTKNFEKELFKYPSYMAEHMLGIFSESTNSYIEGKKCALKATEIYIMFTINNCCEHQNRKFWEKVKEEIYKNG